MVQHGSVLIVLCGLPGIGKSTDTQWHRQQPDWFVYSTDDYLELVAEQQKSDYNTVFEEHIKPATTEMNRMLLDAIEDRRNILWDQTNLTRKKRRAILERVPDSYQKQCWYYPLSTSNIDDWRRRLSSRPGKHIPKKVLNSMVERMETPQEHNENFDLILVKDQWNANY